MKYMIFNKSSESMSEIRSELIDIVFFSPPYNIGASMDSDIISPNVERYFEFIKNVIRECSRTLKKDGRLIVEAADSILTNGRFVQLAGLIQKYAVVDANMFLETRHINFIKTRDIFELPDHGFDGNHSASSNAHSNCHQILVFNKSKVSPRNGEILYINYDENPDEHPCAEPMEMIDFILKRYFKPGMKVLDSFMGTANLGVHVIKNGGLFFGYEIKEEFYTTAKRKLQSA